jgi:hypothetical protein
MARINLLLAVILILTGSAQAASSDNGRPNWQLTFRYTATDLELVRASRIPDMNKAVHRPGLKSAPVKVDYDFSWLDASGQPLYSSSDQLPIGIRAILGDNQPCQTIIPDEGVVVVRITGPSEASTPSSLRLDRRSTATVAPRGGAIPASLSSDSWTFPIPASVAAAPEDGPLGVEKIRDTGPDGNRLTIVILGDGYTTANLTAGLFTSDAYGLGNSIQLKSPWDLLFQATNLYRIDVASNEEGSDNEILGVLKDTYLNSSFWTNGVERALALNSTGYLRVFNAADALVGPGKWDIILVLVNSTKYGGTGGTIAVSSVHSSAAEIVIHELGHTFGNLADEYESSLPGAVPSDAEPNVDFDYSGSGLKWSAWVEPATPLPTPESVSWDGVVGAFEGARYFTTGIYRPWYNCEMRSLGRQFCPICREAHVYEFDQLNTLIDGVTPAPGMTLDIDWSGTNFVSEPLPFGDLVFQWSLDGVPIPGAESFSLMMNPGLMTGPTQTLALTITLETELVRLHDISETYTWTVNAIVGECCTGIVGDVNFDGGYEPTIGDITFLIDHLFITERPIACLREADVNQSGGLEPIDADITIGDISTLIDHLFITEIPLNYCF